MVKKTTKRPRFWMSEKVFSKYLKNAFEFDDNLELKRRNVGAMKSKTGRLVRYGEPGQSDFFGTVKKWTCPYCRRVREGVAVEIEVKGIDKAGRRGQVTPAQKKWIETVKKNNGIALVIYPVETDPIGLNTRIWRLIERQLCPQCFGKEVAK